MIYRVDPLGDGRWREFLGQHPQASVFHSPGWLEALQQTYGYQPSVLTTTPPGKSLENAMVYCRVSSWLTGLRLVSLPFSDHCDPLVGSRAESERLLGGLAAELQNEKGKYIEVRARHASAGHSSGFGPGERFCFHQLNLEPPLETLFHKLHKDSTQRKIRRAQREELTCEAGRTEALLLEFYRLLVMTRRRHHVPPPPYRWFQNLSRSMGEQLVVRVARKQGRPVASILTLRFKGTLVYKYGGSEAKFHPLGGMQLLFWQAIEEAKQQGVQEFDLGRSSLDNPGLIAFKDRWGAVRSELTYCRYPAPSLHAAASPWGSGLAGHVFACMPDRVLSTAGRLLYRHVG